MNGRVWTKSQIAALKRLYPNHSTTSVAKMVGRSVASVYGMVDKIGVKKSAQYLASPAACRLRRGDNVGAAYRFPKGHVPANKGLRRPGWAPGRMAETQFKKGHFPVNRDPDFYVLGALRINFDGYIDMRVSFEPGAKGWRPLHRILWEDAHGPVPRGHIVAFKNRDKLDCELANLELLTFAQNMRRNTIHRYPKPLRRAINALGQFKRRVREEQDRRSAQSPV